MGLFEDSMRLVGGPWCLGFRGLGFRGVGGSWV